MELRSPDPCLNPYLAFALLLEAGLRGIRDSVSLPPPVNINLYEAAAGQLAGLAQLPDSLDKAVRLAAQSELIASCLPKGTIDMYLTQKAAEWADYCAATDQAAYEAVSYTHLLPPSPSWRWPPRWQQRCPGASCPGSSCAAPYRYPWGGAGASPHH